MGMLDDLLAGVASGPGPGRVPPQQYGAGGGNAALLALLPIVLSMLARRGAGGAGARPSGPAGGLGDILGQLTGGGQRGGGLGDILGQVLGGGAAAGGGRGGLGGLLGQLESAGFGEQARSWVSTGQNQPVPADALGRVFGADGLAEILFDAVAVLVHLRQRELRTCVALLGGEAIPLHGLPEVLGNAFTQVVHLTEFVLCAGVSFLGRRNGRLCGVPLCGCRPGHGGEEGGERAGNEQPVHSRIHSGSARLPIVHPDRGRSSENLCREVTIGKRTRGA